MKKTQLVPITVLLPKDLVARIDLRSAATGINRGSLMRAHLLRAYPAKPKSQEVSR